MGIIKKIDTIITVVGAAVSTYQLMTKTFKWYERKYGKGKNKKDITEQKQDEEYIRDIFDYLARDLKVSFDGEKVGSQIKNFIKQGKNAKGILFSLIYFYDVQKGDWNNSKDYQHFEYNGK